MPRSNDTTPTRLELAVEAINNLTIQGLDEILSRGQSVALAVHTEIAAGPVTQKSAAFYRHFLPLRSGMVAVLAENYRRYLKLALANQRQCGKEPAHWAWSQLQPAVGASLEWIHDWFILACEGENVNVRRAGSIAFVPGQTISVAIPLTVESFPSLEAWRAPSWLFQISITLVGLGPLKPTHVPATGSEEKLGASHTRLLLKGARRVFLWDLKAAIETVWNEETAAAGAILAQATDHDETARPNKKQRTNRSLRGVEGLGQKHQDLSRYMHKLTEKQQMAFSLKFEYELGLAQIALRMGLDRKTAYEHIEAAKRKVDQVRSAEKRKFNPANRDPE